MRRGLILLLFLSGILGLSKNSLAYSYGPACQWIHLVGKVVVPADQDIARPIELTVTYQGGEMKHPATLLTNFPLTRKDFKFFLAGFDEQIAGVFFASPMFNFAREILFRYYAKSADGKWHSDFFESRYVPELISTTDIPKHREKQFLCHTRVDLDPLVLKPK
jgi:hypothetical protein